MTLAWRSRPFLERAFSGRQAIPQGPGIDAPTLTEQGIPLFVQWFNNQSEGTK